MSAAFQHQPDSHLQPEVAANYDRRTGSERMEEVDRTVAVLSELAEGGRIVEFAVGTGRVALPLAATGADVLGIDFSEPMLDELRKKDPEGSVAITAGDMTSTQVCSDATLVYLVFNTIMNLRSQADQVACFANAAAHLAAGGRFVIETNVPSIQRLPPGETIRPFRVTPDHLGFDEYVDTVEQISISHHYFFDGDTVTRDSPSFRYVWPSELDLMAELAGMRREHRWADWSRAPFTGASPSHVSVWQKA